MKLSFYKISPRDVNMRNMLYIKTPARPLKRLRKRVHEISAAGVVIYDKKVVVLYDKKYKHFVLPQGHRNFGESLRQAAQREIREETGYADITYLKRLYSYRYHFPRENCYVFRTINVYLFKLRTLRKEAPKLEDHEMYQARLVPLQGAITMLRWPQDRLIMQRVMQEIKKGPVRRTKARGIAEN